jgi:hypothetical protein
MTGITLYGGPRHFELANVEADEANNYSPYLVIADGPELGIAGTEFHIYMRRAQLRQLRDLLAAAPLGADEDQYDVVYAAAIRAWEAV